MKTTTPRQADARAEHAPRIDSAELLPRAQSLLAALADIDAAYESDLATVRSSQVPEAVKQEVSRTLQQRHREHCALYVLELDALSRRGKVKA